MRALPERPGFPLQRRVVLCGLLCCLFLAAPSGAEPGSLRVVAISDLNGSYGSTDYHRAVDAAVERILALAPDLVISTGDMVGGQRRPHLSSGQVEAMWSAFHRHVSERLAAAGIPFAVTPGNHDASAYRGFEAERAIFAAQWRARKPALHYIDDTHYPWHYAFARGETLFISLDVTRVGRLDAAQKQWLAALLHRHGGDFRHRVVFSHVPLWPIAQGRETEFSGDLELQALLREGAVGLYLSGHQHAFYPAVHKGVGLLGLSCLGAAPRILLGGARAPRSFALLEIGDETIEVAALRAPGFDTAIPWASLPAQIRTPAATLHRADTVEHLLRELDLPANSRNP